MKPTGGSVADAIAHVTPAVRQRDAETLLGLFRRVSRREPVLWGTIIGFGACHYRYPSGNEGDMPVLAFAPRRAASTIYLDRVERHQDALAMLGPHTSSVACLYLTRLDDVDLDVLEGILRRTAEWVESGGDERMSITVTA